MIGRAVVRAFGWLVVVALVVVLLDVWQGPARFPLPAVVAFSPWLLLAAWPVALLALVARRWALAVAALALVAAQVVVLLPSFAPWHSPPPAAAGSTFTLFDQNVRFDNLDLGSVARQVTATRPDLVLLEELSAENYPSLQASGALAGYPYALVLKDAARGYGVWSRLPLTDVHTWPASDVQMVSAVLAAPGGAVDLLLVHTTSPASRADAPRWSAQMTAVAARIESASAPVMVVGDFNATVAMRQMRGVLATGVRDAATTTGEGWRQTWPDDGRFPFRVFRLDHVLLAPPLIPTSYRLGDPGGSDHSPLLVTVGRRA